MRKRSLVAGIIVLMGSAAMAALPPFKLSPNEYMRVSEVRPGMTGYGLTVFKGVKIEKFGVRVIAVMPQQNAGRTLVLVMMSGGPITKRHANIIAGMSGSPVYINGKLLGAVAYGDSLPKEPMAMITPIEDMVDSFDPRLPSRPSYPVSTNATGLSAVDPGLSPMSEYRALPVFASGFRPRSLSTLNQWLKPYSLQAMSGPGGGGGSLPSYFPKGVRLEPGSAIAVSLAQGDVDISAIGTVTYRRGNRFLAFGHPFLQIGAAEFPASTAYIHDVFSSVSRSYKLGSAIETVGMIQQDMPFSVGGLMHRLPKMVPVNVHISDRSTGRVRDYKVGVINHPVLAPGLVISAAQELIDRHRAFPGDSMARLKFTVYPEGMAPISRTNTVFDSGSVSMSALSDVLEAMIILSRNPFEPVRLRRVDIRVDMENGHRTGTVERAWIEKDKVEPGDTVVVQAVVKPFKKPAETRTLRVKIPENSPNGQAQIVVFGGLTGFGRITAGPAPPGATVAGGSSSVANIKQLVAKFTAREKNNELGLRVLMPGSVIAVDGQRFSGLPDPLADIMKSTKSSSTRMERDEIRLASSVETPYVLAGQQMLVVNIERKNPIEKAGAAVTSSTSVSIPAVMMDSSDSSLDAVSADAYSDLGPATADAYATALAAPTQKPEPAKPETKATDTKASDTKPGDTKPADAKTTDAKPDESDAEKDGKGPGRLATVWKQSTKAQFEAGEVANTTVTSKGDVTLTPRLEKISDTGRPIVWALLPQADGSTLAGTGNGGEILRIALNGKTTVLADTDELVVQSLASSANGAVYAGTGPNGRVLRLTPEGKSSLFFATGEKYVFALVTAADGTLYAATGPNGRVFVIAPDGKGRELAKLPEANVIALKMMKDGLLLAGTSPDGLVYKITTDGKTSVVFDAPETNVTAVASDADGRVYASTAPNGKVYRLLPDGRAEILLEKADGTILALAASGDGTLLVGGGKKVYRITPDKVVTLLDNDDQNQIVCLAVGPDGALRVGTANTGVVYRVQTQPTGTYVSPVRDADPRAVWGRMEWQSDVPDGASLGIQTRTGAVAQPDSTWSEWSPSLSNADASPVQSPPARFFQYRATLKASPTGDSPSLKWVSLRYLTDNRPPTVKFSDPKKGDHWGGKKTVKWTGSDPDSDMISYTLFVSSDTGATWKALNTVAPETKADVKPAAETPKPADSAKPADDTAQKAKKEARDAETMKQVTAELDKYTDMAPDVKASVQEAASASLKATSKDALVDEKANGDNLTKTTYAWDTAATPDGLYYLKVVATDKASNPASALSVEEVSGGIYVANSKPVVTIAEKDTKVSADLTVTLSGRAKTSSAVILRISYRVDKGTWLSAIAKDGILDSQSEDWSVITDALTKGEHSIEVKVTDEMDNNASAITKVTIP